jgi:hypothetical protein
MSIKTLLGLVAAISVAAALSYGAAYLMYQPALDDYAARVSDLEVRLNVSNSRIQLLEEEAAIHDDQYLSLEADYQRLTDRLDNLSEASGRLKIDRAFMQARLNQMVVVTQSFDDELVLWQDMQPVAEEFDPELLSMIDGLLRDYREHFNWVDDIKGQDLTPIEAVAELNKGYDLVWKIIDDVREFDAYWIERVEQDMGETLGPLRE